MKVLNIDGEYFLYPNGINSVDEFSVLLDTYNHKFIKIRKLFEKNCVSPYYIFEEIKEIHLSVSNINEFVEEEVVILNRDEYEKLLNNVKNKLCSRCEEREDCFANQKEEYRESLCLDGTCFGFCEED